MFDTGVVSVSVALLIINGRDPGGNSWIKQLRVLRAFRLLRLLGKLGDLKKIIKAVAMSLLPTLQALVSVVECKRTPSFVHCHFISQTIVVVILYIELTLSLLTAADWTGFYLYFCRLWAAVFC